MAWRNAGITYYHPYCYVAMKQKDKYKVPCPDIKASVDSNLINQGKRIVFSSGIALVASVTPIQIHCYIGY